MRYASFIRKGGRGLLALAAVAGVAACSGTPLTPTSDYVSPVSETFSSLLSVSGTALRVIAVPDRGPVEVSLAATTPASLSLGLGIGIPKTNGGCAYTVTGVSTAGGPPLSALAGQGRVCVAVFDLGGLTSQVGFTLTIVHP